jgi:hypothetical protein
MFRNSKKSAVLDRTGASDIVGRAATVAQQTADHAAVLAQTAIDAARPAVHKATPAVRRSASVASAKLGGAAERASSALAGTAEWLADTAETQKALAKKASPKRHRKLKRLVAISALLGALVALVKSPFCGKLRDKLTGGPYPDEMDETEGITLSVDSAFESTSESGGDGAGGSDGAGISASTRRSDTAAAKASTESNGVAATKSKERADN